MIWYVWTILKKILSTILALSLILHIVGAVVWTFADNAEMAHNHLLWAILTGVIVLLRSREK